MAIYLYIYICYDTSSIRRTFGFGTFKPQNSVLLQCIQCVVGILKGNAHHAPVNHQRFFLTVAWQGGTSSHTNITNRNQWTYPWSVNISHFLAPGSLKSFWVLLTLGHKDKVGSMSRCRRRWWKNTSIWFNLFVPVFHVKNLPDLTMLWSDWIELPRLMLASGAEIWHSLLFGKDVGSVFSETQCCGEGNQIGAEKLVTLNSQRSTIWPAMTHGYMMLDDVRWLDSRCNAPRP